MTSEKLENRESQKSEVAHEVQISEDTEVPRRKIDIRAALAVIPPASQLFAKEKRPKERRIRLRFHSELKKGVAKINPELASELGITGKLEIVVASRRRLVYSVELDDSVPLNEVWVNGEGLPQLGIADNTIATVRAARSP